jgi:hypothetical protein
MALRNVQASNKTILRDGRMTGELLRKMTGEDVEAMTTTTLSGELP